MTIGEIVRLKILPEEKFEVIDQRGEMFCLVSVEENRMAIWAKDEEIMQEELPDRNALVKDFINSSDKYLFFS